ncbi:MAG TPA: dihydrofolate reductase family protein [Microlunatus sp.]
MGEIHVDLFSTLDGVIQAPGGPDEDTESGFAFGGWQAPLFDDESGQQVDAGLRQLDALLLGRKTYDIFAGYWPTASTDSDIAALFNRVPKYVASRSNRELDWAGSVRIGDDLATELTELKQRHQQIHVIGSGDLFQTLQREHLFDRLNLFIYPITLGTGKRAFGDGTVPAGLRLVEPAVTTAKGAVVLHYAATEEVPTTGDMDKRDDPSD